jgi:oligoendopeptidase F
MNNKWNLKLIYETEEDFTNDLNKCLDYVSKIEGLKGKLNNNVDIKKYFSLNKELDQLLSKVFSYASQSHHLNQKEVSAAKRYQLVYQKYLEAVSRLSFVEPELLQNKYEDLMALCDSDSDVANSRFMIQKLFKRQSHVLDVKTEGVMALYNDATTGYQNLYSALCEQDSTPKKVTLTSGKEVLVSHATYTSLLQSLESQEDRRIVFEALYSYYDTHKHTLSGIYKGIMAGENAERINRGYNTTLDMFLDSNDINTDVFKSLIDVASNDNEAIKRYYNLRKNYFKLDNLYTYDRFLQFRKTDINFTYEKQKELVLEADKELGSDYYNKACKVLEDGRVDVEPCDGKYNGAYSTHIYDKGTFILLNNTNNLESAFTLAHEAGHSIHSMYSIEAQPYETHDYVIFVAEVASTFNEARFLEYMLKNTKNKDERIVLLQKAIDNLIATFYRQALFAHYEYLAHEKYEAGEVIDEEVLSNIMKDLYKKYYGLDLSKEELTKYVWAYIPHLFRSPFYVYQYATSYAASALIYENVSKGTPHAFDNYINLLRSGGSDYPVNLLKKAGVDLTKPDAFKAVARRLDELVSMLADLIK